MQLTVLRDDPEALALWCEGEITQDDFAAEPNPLAALLGPGAFARRVLLDLGGVTLLGSIGVGWLVSSHYKFQAQGGRLIIHSMRDTIDQVFKLLRVDDVLEMAVDELAALARLAV